MRIPTNDWQSQQLVTANTQPGLCPRMHWRSTNPSLPPPDSLTCRAPGPDCCATPAAAHVRRAA